MNRHNAAPLGRSLRARKQSAMDPKEYRHGVRLAAVIVGALLVAGSPVSSAAPPGTAFEPANLQANWTFAEGSGTQAADSSGGDYHGTLQGGATWTMGKIGCAVSLDGTSGTVLLPSDMAVIQNVPAISVSGWVNLTALPGSGQFGELISISIGNAGTPTNSSRLAVAFKGDGTAADIYAGARTQDGGGQQSLTADVNIAAGVWTHVAAVLDFPGDTIKVFVNGILADSASVAFVNDATPNTASTNGAIGAQDLGDSNFLHSLVDELRVYGRALSDSEVANLARGDGLKAHWKLDEGQGTVAGDSTDNLFTGTLQNDLDQGWTTGQMGSALAFNGQDHHISLPGGMSAIRNVNAVSVMGWIKPTEALAAGSFREIVSISVNDPSGPTNLSRVALALQGDGTGGDIYVGGRSTDGESQKRLVDDSSLTVGEWHHVAGVIDYTNKTITVYVDGLQTATGVADFAQPHTANTVSTNGAIGAQDQGTSNFIKGCLDDVRVYCKALSQSEIQKLVLNDGLKAHWKFDEGTGTTTSDSSGNGVDGTLTGGATWGTGQFGNAVSLNGVDGWVDIGADLDMLQDVGAVSISGWVNIIQLPAAGSFYEILSVSVNDPSGPTNSSRVAFALKGDGGAADLFAGARTTDTGGMKSLTGDVNIPATTWTHVAVVMSFGGDTIKIYVGGQLLVSGSVDFTNDTTPDTPSTNSAIGAQDKGDSNFAHALYDELRVYCRALTDAEILELATVSAPPAPANLVATAGDTFVDVSWDAAAGATSYDVYRSTDNVNFSVVANVTTTSHRDEGLTNGTEYFYKVKAVNAAGPSGFSNTDSATPTAGAQPPAAPQILTVSKKTNDTQPDIIGTSDPNVTITVTFDDGTTQTQEQTTADFLGNWLLDPAVKTDADYAITATATNAGGTSGSSNGIVITVDTMVAPPSNVQTQAFDGQVHVTWTASPDTDVIGYEVWRSENGGAFSKAHLDLVVDVFFCDDQVTNGFEYCYRVRAVDDTLQEVVNP